MPFAVPEVDPAQVMGLEISEYAVEIAQAVIWIGYLQWRRERHYSPSRPVLKPLTTIREQDALLDLSDPEHPKEATWPAAEFIIGNPPFLGRKKLKVELGSEYVSALFRVYEDRLPKTSDLCCYFFEKARMAVCEGTSKRAGLLATATITSVQNRDVLTRIQACGGIFAAWVNERWTLDGASVRISIILFDDGSEAQKYLNGEEVNTISTTLTGGGVDLLSARSLIENRGMAFQGDTKGGPFEIPPAVAQQFLSMPTNPHGKSNHDVVRRWFNGKDIMDRPSDMWIIDFGVDTSLADAALYQGPFEYAVASIRPFREASRSTTGRWWLHERPRREMREALSPLHRFIATVRVAKHRVFVWLPGGTIPDNRLAAIARDDDYFFGVLSSRAHERWSLVQGARHGVGNDPTYTPTTCFETFPFPWPPGAEPVDDPLVQEIAAAAKELDERRRAWLDPPGASEADLKKRTLTNLYNERPTWLQHLHDRLDQAV
jgi:type II restriction/modification system DNA methylase subunit YeeA